MNEHELKISLNNAVSHAAAHGGESMICFLMLKNSVRQYLEGLDCGDKVQPAWNGKGLPPVGTECEIDKKIDSVADAHEDEEPNVIDGRWKSGDSVVMVGSVFLRSTKKTAPVVFNVRTQDASTIRLDLLRPIRTEAEKQREADKRELNQLVVRARIMTTESLVEEILDAGFTRGRKDD